MFMKLIFYICILSSQLLNIFLLGSSSNDVNGFWIVIDSPFSILTLLSTAVTRSLTLSLKPVT